MITYTKTIHNRPKIHTNKYVIDYGRDIACPYTLENRNDLYELFGCDETNLNRYHTLAIDGKFEGYFEMESPLSIHLSLKKTGTLGLELDDIKDLLVMNETFISRFEDEFKDIMSSEAASSSKVIDYRSWIDLQYPMMFIPFLSRPSLATEFKADLPLNTELWNKIQTMHVFQRTFGLESDTPTTCSFPDVFSKAGAEYYFKCPDTGMAAIAGNTGTLESTGSKTLQIVPVPGHEADALDIIMEFGIPTIIQQAMPEKNGGIKNV